MLFKLFDHLHKKNKLLRNQVSYFSFISIEKSSNVFFICFLEISSCCSVSKPKDYEYISYELKQSSKKDDYVSYSFRLPFLFYEI